MQEQDAIDRRACITYDDSVGQRSKRSGHTLLEAGLHGEQGGDGADDTDGLAGLKKGAGPVAAREGDAQCLESGRKRGTLALALTLLVTQCFHGSIRIGEIPLGLFVLGVEAELAGIEASHLRLKGGELTLCRRRTRAGILSLRRCTLDLRGTRFAPRAGCGDATRQASEILTMIGLGADALRDPTLLFCQQALRLGSATRRVGQCGTVGLDLPTEGELLLAQ